MTRTPDDLKSYSAADDPFQLVPPHTSGWLLLTAVILACILEPVLR